MRKFFSIIGMLIWTVVLLIVGILGSIFLGKVEADAAQKSLEILFGIIMVIVGYGGAIATALMTIANFFKIKTKAV